MDALIKKIDKIRIEYVIRRVVVKNGKEIEDQRFEKAGTQTIGQINDYVQKVFEKKHSQGFGKKKVYRGSDVHWYVYIKLEDGDKWLVCEPECLSFNYRFPSPRTRAIRLALQEIADETQYDY